MSQATTISNHYYAKNVSSDFPTMLEKVSDNKMKLVDLTEWMGALRTEMNQVRFKYKVQVRHPWTSTESVN